MILVIFRLSRTGIRQNIRIAVAVLEQSPFLVIQMFLCLFDILSVTDSNILFISTLISCFIIFRKILIFQYIAFC